MKTKFIVAILAAVIVSATIFALSIKIQKEHYEIKVLGLKDVYTVGEPFTFGYTISGYGYSCGDKEVHIPDDDGDSKIMYVRENCDANLPKKDFEYSGRSSTGSTIFEHPGINRPVRQHISVTYEHGTMGPTIGGKSFHVVEKICDYPDIRHEAECLSDSFDSCTSAYLQQVNTLGEGHIQLVTAVVESWYECNLRVYTEFLEINETNLTRDIHDYNLQKRSICDGITIQEGSWVIYGCNNEENDIRIKFSEKRETEQFCQMYNGSWNEDLAACFDYAKEFDCQKFGGVLVKPPYGAQETELIKQTDYVCKFRK